GQGLGTAQIQALDGSGRPVALLDVTVKKRLPFKVAFHRVWDITGSHSNRPDFVGTNSMASVLELFMALNDIIEPQTKVEFLWHPKPMIVHDMRNNPISPSLGRVVSFVDGEFGIVTSRRDRGAEYNVFFVWEYETRPVGPNPPDVDNAGTFDFQFQ